MKTFNLFLGAAAFLTLISQAEAHHQCIREEWFRLGSETADLGKCVIEKPLALAKMEKWYPSLGGPYTVEYWEGSFTREATDNVTYLHEIYNICTGKTFVSETVSNPEKHTLDFKIDNPNLSDDIKTSYELVPMATDEAQEAFKKTQRDCETK